MNALTVKVAMGCDVGEGEGSEVVGRGLMAMMQERYADRQCDGKAVKRVRQGKHGGGNHRGVGAVEVVIRS